MQVRPRSEKADVNAPKSQARLAPVRLSVGLRVVPAAPIVTVGVPGAEGAPDVADEWLP